ncbi:hypothetical protein Ddc_02809 [Ditylenchus destructor]|nr:hypothetical protein Ddc_02809 [Ditylenchus destructor]
MGSNISNPNPTDEFYDPKYRKISTNASIMFKDTEKILLSRLNKTEKSTDTYSSTERSDSYVLSRPSKAKKKCLVGRAGFTCLDCSKRKCVQKCEKFCVQLRKWPKASLKCDKSRNSTFWTNSEMESSSTFFQTLPIIDKSNQEILQELILCAPAKSGVTAVNGSTNYADVCDGLKTSISALYPSVPPPEYSQISPKITNRDSTITSLWPNKSAATTQNIDDFATNARFDPCGIDDQKFQLDMGGSSEDCQMTFDRGEKTSRENPHNTDSSHSVQRNKHQHFVIPSGVLQNLQIYSQPSTPITEIPHLTVLSSDSLQKYIPGAILKSESSSMRRSTNAKSHPNLQNYASSKSKKRHISTSSKPHSKENRPIGFIVPPVFPHSCSLFDTAFHGGVYPQNSKEDTILLDAVEKARKRWESTEFVTGELTSRKEDELSTNCTRNPEETSWDSGRSSLSGHEEETATLQKALKDVKTCVDKQSVIRDSCLGSPGFCSDPQSTISSKSEEAANQEHLEDDVFEKPGQISLNSQNGVNRRRSMSTPIDPRLSKSDTRKQRTSWKQKVLRTFSAGSVGKTKGRKDSKKGNRKG